MYETYKKAVIEMINDNESFDYIRIYINDLMRGNDITIDERNELFDILINNHNNISYGTIKR